MATGKSIQSGKAASVRDMQMGGGDQSGLAALMQALQAVGTEASAAVVQANQRAAEAQQQAMAQIGQSVTDMANQISEKKIEQRRRKERKEDQAELMQTQADISRKEAERTFKWEREVAAQDAARNQKAVEADSKVQANAAKLRQQYESIRESSTLAMNLIGRTDVDPDIREKALTVLKITNRNPEMLLREERLQLALDKFAATARNIVTQQAGGQDVAIPDLDLEQFAPDLAATTEELAKLADRPEFFPENTTADPLALNSLTKALLAEQTTRGIQRAEHVQNVKSKIATELLPRLQQAQEKLIEVRSSSTQMVEDQVFGGLPLALEDIGKGDLKKVKPNDVYNATLSRVFGTNANIMAAFQSMEAGRLPVTQGNLYETAYLANVGKTVAAGLRAEAAETKTAQMKQALLSAASRFEQVNDRFERSQYIQDLKVDDKILKANLAVLGEKGQLMPSGSPGEGASSQVQNITGVLDRFLADVEKERPQFGQTIKEIAGSLASGTSRLDGSPTVTLGGELLKQKVARGQHPLPPMLSGSPEQEEMGGGAPQTPSPTANMGMPPAGQPSPQPATRPATLPPMGIRRPEEEDPNMAATQMMGPPTPPPMRPLY